MTVNFYKTISNTKDVYKNLTATTSHTINKFDEPLNIIHPVFCIDSDNFDLSSNYCYCDTLGRYYFIDNIDILSAKRYRVYCTIDVLYTYRAQLQNCVACVTRSESVGTPTYVIDSRLPIHPTEKEIDSLTFGSRVFEQGSNCFLLAVLGV